MGGEPRIPAKDRPNWDFGKTTINSLMISVIWNGTGVPLISTLLPPELSSNGAGAQVRHPPVHAPVLGRNPNQEGKGPGEKDEEKRPNQAH